jgi:hypothetical protein
MPDTNHAPPTPDEMGRAYAVGYSAALAGNDLPPGPGHPPLDGAIRDGYGAGAFQRHYGRQATDGAADSAADAAPASSVRFGYAQEWEESEAGWGVRPDGFSLHESYEAAKQFVREYWDSMPDRTPAGYSRPSGEPFRVAIDDPNLVFDTGGKRIFRRHLPDDVSRA